MHKSATTEAQVVYGDECGSKLRKRCGTAGGGGENTIEAHLEAQNGNDEGDRKVATEGRWRERCELQT